MPPLRHALHAALLLTACQPGGATFGAVAQHDPRETRTLVAPAGRSDVTPAPEITSAPPTAGAVTAAPFSLTASDGTGLALERVDAKAVLQGPLAFTELHLYFTNPERRVREGTFAVTLPTDAAVSRFAMELDGAWQEAEVVEKQAGRRVYDDFLHRRQDPALLEKAAGNQFSAKVFPIPANGKKHLVISFTQPLGARPYTLPLRGLPRIDRVDVELRTTGLDNTSHDQALHRRRWQPDVDFIADLDTQRAAAVNAGELVAMSLVLPRRAQPGGSFPTGLTLLIDTSASRAPGFARYVASVRALIARLRDSHGEQLPVQVVAFDQDTQVIHDGPVAGYGDEQDRRLQERGAAGASDLTQALTSLRAPRRRVVIVTDGVITAGLEKSALANVVKTLPIDRIDVVLSGGIRDERAAASLTRAGLPDVGDVFDLDAGIAEVAAGLGQHVLTDVEIDIPGAAWLFPRKIPAARPGSQRMVYARLSRPTRKIEVRVGGEPTMISLGVATPALVQRAIAAAAIEELDDQLSAATDDEAARRLRDEIAKHSVSARVISSQTAMLVLESEADYERYNIPRTALADVLVIGPRGLEQQTRSSIQLARADTRPGPTSTTDVRSAGPQDAEETRSAGRVALADTWPGPTLDPQIARQQPLEQARSAGILRSEPLSPGSVPVTPTGASDLTTSRDDETVHRGLEDHARTGGSGYGRSGFGTGGGGDRSAMLAVEAQDATDLASAPPSGYGVGGGRGAMRGRSAAAPQARLGKARVNGAIDHALLRRALQRNISRISYCYERIARPGLSGTLTTRFAILPNGTVTGVTASGVDARLADCVVDVIATLVISHPGRSGATVTYPITFSPPADDARDASLAARDDASDPSHVAALTGRLAEVIRALERGDTKEAEQVAAAWREGDPGDVLALIACGEVLERQRDLARAARIYGSIIDLFPMRADLRRFAGERLERVGVARSLVVDTYRRAVADRPDHATGHRLLAYALVRTGDYAGAFAAILQGVDQRIPNGRHEGANIVLGEDAGMIAAAYLAHGGARHAVLAELDRRGLEPITTPSTRFMLYWETDANDVDFHVRDAHAGHAWYVQPALASGGKLYADVTTGYGPECFAIPGTPTAGPYRLSIHYYSRGPMGYGMGLLQVQRFTGKEFEIDDRPFVVMNDRAFVDLGSYL